MNTTDIMGMSLMHFAAMNRKKNNTDILRNVIQKGAKVNVVARDNTTPLDYAATTGNAIKTKHLRNNSMTLDCVELTN